MAFDFFKKGLFKKKQDPENNHLKEKEVSVDPVQNDMNESQSESSVISKDEIVKGIFDRLEISVNTPLKLLWNIFYKDSDKAFNPMEFAFEPIIQANTKINEINERFEREIVELDDNQKDFKDFTNRIQSVSLKLARDIIQESPKLKLEDYIGDIDIYELDANIRKYSDYDSFDEFKFACISEDKKTNKEMSDAQIFLQISKNKLHCWIMVIPPINGGSDLSTEVLVNYLQENKVISGINKSAIKEICENKKYFYIYEIATGKYAIDGKDGYIVDKFPRKNIIDIREDENGNLNYKELNNIRSVHKDDVICEIYYPIDGEKGKRVDGQIVEARVGKQPKIPKGKNIALSQDKSLLIAEKDGELLFKDDVFMINELLTIDNDVDNASGNITFAGDVLIKGDVREGFSVKAEGNITILGTCEGATIVSAGNITINRGMTGGGKGVIKASGNLKTVFLENCSAYAKGTIEVDQVMYSELSSGDSVVVKGKKGSVTGGKIIAGKSITANVIGAANNSYLKTDVVLGCTPDMIKRHTNIENTLKGVTEKLFKLNQDISYIEDNIDRMPEDRISKMEQMKVQKKFMILQKETLEKNFEELTNEMEETAKNCKFKCKTLNPIINFSVGESTYTLHKPLSECSLYIKDGAVVLSSMSLAENIVF